MTSFSRLHYIALCLFLSTPAFAQQPLHQRIDALVAAKTPNYDKIAAALADDAEFLRRIYLDLTGCVPSANQARAFLDDKDANKRQKLIEQLLASPEHARHL